MSERVFDHIDQHVRSVSAVKPFYDAFLKNFGFRKMLSRDDTAVYVRIIAREVQEAFAVIEDPVHVPGQSCFGFRASSPADVDRIAATLEEAGAREIEGPVLCPEYTLEYYAVFFKDPDGNRLEVAFR